MATVSPSHPVMHRTCLRCLGPSFLQARAFRYSAASYAHGLCPHGCAQYEDCQTLTVLNVEDQEGTCMKLSAFRAGKPLVLDFWHTRCVKCPAALTKLDMIAPLHPGVLFASCCLSLGSETEGTQEQVLELLEDQWENLKHVYMTVDEKEAAKRQFGFSAVPFCVVFDADGAELYRGDPGSVDFSTVFNAATAAEPVAEPASQALPSTPVKTGIVNTTAGVQASDKPPAALDISKKIAQESPGSVMDVCERVQAAAARPPVVFGFGNDDEDF